MAKRLLRCIDGHVFDASESTRCPVCGADATGTQLPPGEDKSGLGTPEGVRGQQAAGARRGSPAKNIAIGVVAIVIAGASWYYLSHRGGQSTGASGTHSSKPMDSSLHSSTPTAGNQTHAHHVPRVSSTTTLPANQQPVSTQPASTAPAPIQPVARPQPVTTVLTPVPPPSGISTAVRRLPVVHIKHLSHAVLAGMVNKGIAFDTGQGELPNEETGLYWFKKAAASGSAHAMNILGWVYAQGMGVQPDPATAKHWFEKSINAGDGSANYGLGMLYDNGQPNGIAHPTRAMALYHKAAAAGSGNAMYAIGNHYLNGFGVPKNPVKAAHWLAKGAKAGSAQAMRLLSQMYMQGLGGLPQNYAIADQWAAKAIKAGLTSGLPELPKH